MRSRKEEIAVLLDLNVLGWLCGLAKTSPTGVDLGQEMAALHALAILDCPVVSFKYPEHHLEAYYSKYMPEILKTLPHLNASVWGPGPELKKELEWFEASLREQGEKQDDVEILSVAAFLANKQISHIVTFDLSFQRRVATIHGRIRKNEKILEWVTKNRPDFFSIRICLPSELLGELRDQHRSRD